MFFQEPSFAKQFVFSMCHSKNFALQNVKLVSEIFVFQILEFFIIYQKDFDLYWF